MKLLLIVSLLLIGLSPFLYAQNPSGWYCEYTFDGTTDRTGVFGTDQADYNTASVVADRFGNPSRAVHFDGTSSNFISYPMRNFTPIDNDTVSMTMWVKLDAAGQGSNRIVIAHYYPAQCGDTREFLVNLTSDDSLQVVFYEAGSNPNFYNYRFGTITDTAWHQIAYTYAWTSGTPAITAYLDGVQQQGNLRFGGPGTTWTGMTGGVARTGIGGYPQVGSGPCIFNNPMHGAIDDICVFSCVLTPTEVLDKYNTPNPVLSISSVVQKEKPLLVYPNPASTMLTIAHQQADWTEVVLMGLDGRIYLQQPLTSAPINIQQLPQGLYVVLVKDANHAIVGRQKVMKQ